MTSSSIARTSRAGSIDAGGMRNRGIAEHADDVEQRVRVAERRDVEQRLGAGAGAGGAGHVGELDRRRHALAGIEERGEPVEALVRDARDADVRVRLAARPWRLAGARQELEEGRTA